MSIWLHVLFIGDYSSKLFVLWLWELEHLPVSGSGSRAFEILKKARRQSNRCDMDSKKQMFIKYPYRLKWGVLLFFHFLHWTILCLNWFDPLCWYAGKITDNCFRRLLYWCTIWKLLIIVLITSYCAWNYGKVFCLIDYYK